MAAVYPGLAPEDALSASACIVGAYALVVHRWHVLEQIGFWMLIADDNASQGNRAMAWVLLLYYHLLREGGFTHDQTVYVDAGEFNAFEYVAVQVAPGQQSEINQRLIRQGAVIYLLCELNDLVSEFEEDYLQHHYAQSLLRALRSEPAKTAVPEVADIVQLASAGLAPGDHTALQGLLQNVFETYVVQGFRSLADGKQA
jgi:hypothetical protein